MVGSYKAPLARVSVLVRIVRVGTDKRCLDKSKHVGRSDVARGVVLSPAVVAEVVGVAGVREVDARNEVLEQVNVGIETDVQTVEVVAACRSVALGVAEREVVHGDFVTTVYAHLVVLRKRIVVEVLLPVGLVVVEIIVEAIGVVVEEVDGLRAGVALAVGDGTDEFREVIAVLVGVHHLHLFGSSLETGVGTEVDARSHALAAAGLDNQHAVGTLGTVEGCTVLDHLHAFDVVGVDDVEHIVDEALVDGSTVVLHINHYTVDDDEGLRAAVERVETVHEHHCTLRRHAAASNHTEVACKTFLHLVLDSEGVGFVDVHHRIVVERSAVGIEVGVHAAGEESVGSLVPLNRELGGVVSLSVEVENVHELGYADDIASALVGHGRVVAVVECLNLDTCHGLLGSTVENVARNLLHLVGGRFLGRSGCVLCRFLRRMAGIGRLS